MNSKLKAFIGQRIRPPDYRGRSGFAKEELVVLTKNTEGGKAHILRISLHGRAAKDAGFLTGDSIDLKVTADGLILERVQPGAAPKLCASSGTGKGSTRRYVRYPVTEQFFDALENAIGKEVEIIPGMIAFSV